MSESWKILLLGILFFQWNIAIAADASFAVFPSEKEHAVGEPFVIDVMLSSNDTPVGAIEGRLSFDSTELKVLSVSTADSIVSQWTQPPVFGNDNGSIVFGGLTATSGYKGIDTRVLRIEFEGLRPASARVLFDSGSAAHAADGVGTNVLTSMKSGLYALVPQSIDPVGNTVIDDAENGATTSGEVLGVMTMGPIISPSHGDQAKWYYAKDAVFTWDVATGTHTIITGFDKKPTGKPTVRSTDPITEKKVSDLTDGVWYFHLTRIWGEDSQDSLHYQVNVDTTLPTQVLLQEVERADKTDPRVSFFINATDTVSGVDHYEFILDDGVAVPWQEEGKEYYELSNVGFGDHTLKMRVYDRAQNVAETKIPFTVAPIATPTIDPVTQEFEEGMALTLSGRGVPDGSVTMYIEHDDNVGTEYANTDSSGIYRFGSAGILAPGVYSISATARDARGAQSKKSEAVTIVVKPTFGGMIKRHPFVPIAGIGFILLLGVSIVVFLRWRKQREAEDFSDEEEVEEEIIPSTKPYFERPAPTQVIASSRVPERKQQRAVISGNTISLK